MPNYPSSNHLLSALTPVQFDKLMPDLELVALEQDATLNTSSLQYMHFPLNCVAAMFHTGSKGERIPIAITGNEGAVGISLFFVGEAAFDTTQVIDAGYAYRLDAKTLNKKYGLDSPLQQLLFRYSQVLVIQMRHSARCRRNHSIEQQLCRWLLSSLDRLPSLELQTTQEKIANKLGMPCQNVIETTQKLLNMGLIDIDSDHISINDRRSIEARACGCYAEIKRESAHLSI